MVNSMKFQDNKAEFTITELLKGNKVIVTSKQTGFSSVVDVEFDERNLRKLRRWITTQLKAIKATTT